MEKNQKYVKILAPAGSFESLRAAIKAGADSVYFGVEHLNMRANSTNNFKLKDLKKIISLCKKNNVKAYLTLNTIMYDDDLKLMRKICDEAKKNEISAVIASDTSVIEYARSIGLNIHCSTQLNISNIDAVKFYSRYADTIVLARELDLEKIESICDEIKKQNIKGPNNELIKIEIFAHGALCVSIAGKCYMSLVVYNSSANRGNCFQNCRRTYKVTDEETGFELQLDNKYVMSPKDLCTINFLDKILDSGIDILKIEGRGKGPEYVFTTTKVYKEAAESYYKKEYTQNKINKWIKELESVFNRGFWHGGYYLGKKLGDWANSKGNNATKEKILIGFVKNYFCKNKVAEIFLQMDSLKLGDEVIITGPTTGIVDLQVKCIRIDDKDLKRAEKNATITIPVNEKVRRNDSVFVLRNRL
ncbi:U32 family peptidase [Candidatus Woesearchaeota archaeon]|nr:U32 family peptidase [Candidatus Woesearchaeota archaeon]